MPLLSIQNTERRNFVLGVTNGVLFQAVETFTDTALVMVTFASHLTGSNFILGLVSPIRQAGWFLPQLWVSGWVQSQPHALKLYKTVGVIRLVVFLCLVIAILTVDHPTHLLLLFLLLIGGQQLTAGFGGLSFMEVVAKTVASERRGVFFAWRLGLGGVLGVACGFVVRWALDERNPLGFPANFALLFSLAGLGALLGIAAFAGVREPVNGALAPRSGMRSQLHRARMALRDDSNYRRLLQLRLALIAAGMGTPFFALYAQRALGLPTSALGWLLSASIAASLAAYPIWGRLSARRGNRAVLTVAGVLGIGVSLLLLVAAPLSRTAGPLALFLAAFAIIGMREAAINVSIGPLLLNVAPAQHRPLYVGFTNTVVGAAILASGVSGLIVDQFGYLALFTVGLVAYVVALWQIVRIHEPVGTTATATVRA
ncbi:MAG: MFS transporter [Ardenticatenaceae bacterium]|nr:MFS transporter [Ardenticatenaceae bacterium]HBY97180.1 hypothetical protein [Chloroflexota bacterium]